jgi:hypothetical protein
MASVVYRDLSVDKDTHDLVIVDGDLVLTSDLDAIAQDVCSALLLAKGEWFLAPDVGLPLFDQIMVKGANPNVVRNLIKAEILAVPGVVGVLQLTLVPNTSTRSMKVSFIADTDVGIIDRTITLGA